MTAAQLMTTGLHTATRATTVPEAMALMTSRRVRHLPIVEDGHLHGLVSIGDVVKAHADLQAHEVDSLKAYVAGRLIDTAPAGASPCTGLVPVSPFSWCCSAAAGSCPIPPTSIPDPLHQAGGPQVLAI